MKKIIFIVSLLLALILYNYPVFNSSGISYILILSCFIFFCFAGAKLYTSNTKHDYDSIEKESDTLQRNDGDFQYTNDGFYIKKEFIKWNQIVEVNSFHIPILHRQHQSGIEVITYHNHYEFNDNNTSGIEKFIDKLYENLPDGEIISASTRINNYGLKKIKLYDRNKTISH